MCSFAGLLLLLVAARDAGAQLPGVAPNADEPLVFEYFDLNNGQKVNARPNPSFSFTRQLQQLSEAEWQRQVRFRYRPVTDPIGAASIEDWRELPYSPNGWELLRDSLCAEYEFETSLLRGGRTYIQRLNKPAPRLIDQLNRRGLVSALRYSSVPRTGGGVINSPTTLLGRQFDSIVAEITFPRRLAFWTQALGATITQAVPIVTVERCKSLFTGVGEDVMHTARVYENPPRNGQPVYLVEFPKSFAEHECTLRIDAVMNVEQRPAQSNRIADFNKPCLTDYRTAASEAHTFTATCDSFGVACRAPQIGCAADCRPQSVRGIPFDEQSDVGELQIQWQFANDPFRSKQEYRLRLAPIDVTSEWQATNEGDANTFTLPATQTSYTFRPPARQRTNYSVQVCAIYDTGCTDEQLDFQRQYAYPVEYGSSLQAAFQRGAASRFVVTTISLVIPVLLLKA